ncbi:caspase, EACC1-associated type [Streptomyces sp. 7R007]
MTESRHALIIANDSYDDRGLKQLKAPGHDADALAEVLRDPQIGDFEVVVIRNQPVQVIRRTIEHFFADRRRDDTLVLHFSCHGLKSESGELYFAASDTEPLLLEATAVAAPFVRRCMSRSRAGRTVLFLDCCYGGAFSRGSSGVRAAGDVNVLDNFAEERPAGGRGWAVITASNSMEYAFEGEQLAEHSARRPSVFTRAVVQGLETGEADLDADGEISLDDLYDYVFDHVREQNPNQTPSKTVELQGELYLAHSRRPTMRIVPEPIPVSWHTALNSRNHFTRLGAVAELRLRLENEDLSRAEGARQALEEVARNDVRPVADAATAALHEVRLRPSTARVDFGRLARGAPVAHRQVALTGLPLARACVPHVSEPWLRVGVSAEGLDVGVDPVAEGRLSGDIVLKGVAGDATIHVEAEVEPAAEARTEEHDARQDTERRTREEQEEAASRRREAEETRRQATEEALRQETERRTAREAEEQAARDAQEPQAPAARETEQQTAREAQERAAREAQEQATRAAQTQTAREAQQQAAPDTQEQAAREAHTQAAPEAQQQAAREARAAPEAQTRAAREAQQLAAREAQTQAAPEAEQQAREAQERAAREAQAQAAREAQGQAAREAQAQAAREAQAQAAREAQAQAAREAQAQAAREAQAQAAREAQARAAREAEVREAQERQVRLEAERRARESEQRRAWAAEQRRAYERAQAQRRRRETAPRRPKTAPLLAVAALVSAAVSLVTVILSALAAIDDVTGWRHDPGSRLEDHVRDMSASLTLALITAAAALLLGAIARHGANARKDRYTATAKDVTASLTRAARIVAVPALVLAVLLTVAHAVVRHL